MHGFTYTIHTLEPILANALGGDANSARSLPFIPGALVRGALIWLYQQDRKLKRLEVGEDDERQKEVRRLFFNGKTRYLHAYPVIDRNEKRSLPAPLAWQKHKRLRPDEAQDDRIIIDLSSAERDGATQLTGFDGASFSVIKLGSAHGADYPDHINVHTQRDAVAGRAKEGQGAVYRYEALPAGYLLKGVILTSTAEDAATLKTLLDGKAFTVGIVSTAGYGAVRATVGDDVGVLWREIPDPGGEDADAGESDSETSEDDLPETEAAMEPVVAESRTFTLTLLSETLVRDENGHHTLDLAPALERRFKKTAASRQHEFTLDEEKTFRKPVIVGGFNRKWGLPLPQTAAIAAGSVFTFMVSPPLEDHELKSLEETGLGERRLDGFGRVAIDWYSTPPERWIGDELDNARRAVSPASGASERLTEPERKLGELMLRRLLRRDLDRALQEAIHVYKVDGAVPNSQLSRWRSVIYHAWSETDPDRRLSRVSEFLEREAGERTDDPTRKEGRSSSGWEKLHRARIEEKRLTEWVREVLIDPNSPWKWLKVAANGQRTLERKTDGQEAEILAVAPDWKTTVEYRLRLIDGVLARAAKDNPSKSEKGGSNG